MFEECQFDQVFYLEDDIRISPHILTLLLNIQHWLKSNYSNVAIISASVYCLMTLEEKQTNLALVSDCGYSVCNRLMTKESWHMIRPWMHEYVQRFLQCHYNERNNEAIIAWMKHLAQRLPVQYGNHMFPVHWDFKRYFLAEPATSQDSMTVLAFRLAGMSHVVATVNRGLHIGRIGENSTEETWQRSYSATALDVFEDDNTLTVFRVKA